MKEIWLKKWGWFYIPANMMAYLISLLAIIFMVPVMMAAGRDAHSVTDELYNIFVYATCTALWWKWIAEKTSK